jgi:hypothetical protein
VLDYHYLELSSEGEAQTYAAIKAALTAATEAIGGIKPVNRDNRQAIFNLIKGRLDTLEELKLTKATISAGVKLMTVKSLVDVIKHLL